MNMRSMWIVWVNAGLRVGWLAPTGHYLTRDWRKAQMFMSRRGATKEAKQRTCGDPWKIVEIPAPQTPSGEPDAGPGPGVKGQTMNGCESCELRHAAEVAVECIEYVKQYVEGACLSAEEDCVEALALLRKALANQTPGLALG